MKTLSSFFFFPLACLILLSPQLSCAENQNVKIGIITDLSAKMPEWGKMTAAGARLAAADLKGQGVEVDLVIEDHAMQPAKAVSAIQKLIEFDRIDSLYSDFSIPSSAIAPIVARTGVVAIFDAPLESAIRPNPRAFRTFIDYSSMCKALAASWQKAGINKVLLLRIASESGDICLSGLTEQSADTTVEMVNSGDDLRPLLLRVEKQGIRGVINLGLEPDVRNTLSIINELHLPLRLGIPANMLSQESRVRFGSSLSEVDLFGFAGIDPEFESRLPPSNYGREAAALAYTHIVQLARAIAACNTDSKGNSADECRSKTLENSAAGGPIGFVKWNNRAAEFKYLLRNAGADPK